MKRDLLERLNHQLVEEKRELFFVCPNDCTRLNFDQSMDFEFHCPECGELISQDDGDKKISDLKKKIEKTEEELKKITVQRKVKRIIVKEKKKEVKAKKKVARKKASPKKKVVKKKPAKKTVKTPVKKNKVVKKTLKTRKKKK